MRSFILWMLGLLVWCMVIAVGGYLLLRHTFAPGLAGRAPSAWPADTTLTLDADRLTLLLFAHRNCPCTRATLNELEEVLAHFGRPLCVQVVLVSPSEEAGDRIGTDIEARARALPGAQVHCESAGAEARRFGVRTSGQVLLYDTEGRLLFSGGITAGRGHGGDNMGRDCLLDCLRGAARDCGSAPVYGCSLFAEDAQD